MKRDFIKKTIAVSLTAMAMLSVTYTKADAEWIKDTEDNWTWNENNEKSTGWKNIEEKWYYFNEKGIMQSGWQEINKVWYYFGNSGDMKTGWVAIDDSWYYFSESGAMQTGWITDQGKWYYLNESGVMVKGWISYNDSWYFTDEHGVMMTGEITIEGKEYDLGSNGAWIENKDVQTNIVPEAIEKPEKVEEVPQLRSAYVIANTTLNVRSEASLNGDIVGRLTRGKEITVVGQEQSGFYKVKSDNLEGWASSEWISFDKNDIPKEPEKEVQVVQPNIITTKPSASSSFNFTSRKSAPRVDDIHYYSDMNIFYKVRLAPPFFSGSKQIVGNCTWYAWGRAWELIGKQPSDAGFVGNAYQWWDANKSKGKFKYGSQPKLGAIAVWSSSMPNSEGCGHVAVVEAIENGKVYISESAWHGTLFKYREIYDTSYILGYIYLDEPNF